MKKEIDIQLSLEIIKKKLKKSFEKGGEPHAELITKMIVENLEMTEMGISHLLMAFMGVEEETPWVEGDECLVHPDSLNRWSWDKELTEKAVPFHKGYIRGKIKKIDFRKKKAVSFTFDGVYSASDAKVKPLTQEVNPSDLKSDEDLKLVRPDLASLM